MTEHRRTGLYGEMAAARFLRDEGYTVLSANFLTKSGELDLVAENGETLCFIEVKTRKAGHYFAPSDAVDENKQSRVRSAAAAYTAMTKIDLPQRFDIIEVTYDDGGFRCSHLKNAF